MKKFSLLCLLIFLVSLFVPFAVLKRMDDPVIHKSEEAAAMNGYDDITISVYFNEEKATYEMDFSEYLIGVLAAEMPASFEMDALKAQAVAARSYSLNKMQSGGADATRHPGGADVCTDYNHCKAYLSNEEMKENFKSGYESYYSKIERAVKETEGEVMVYSGEPICAVFHSNSAGRTENAADVWGSEVPYLKSVESPGSDLSPTAETEAEILKSEFLELSKESGKEIDLFADPFIGEVFYTEGGRVKEITIGGALFSGGEIRGMLSLRSTNFKVKEGENSLIFTVSGSGHGVGLSQYGAQYMAIEGKSYREILYWYYEGAELEKIPLTNFTNSV